MPILIWLDMYDCCIYAMWLLAQYTMNTDLYCHYMKERFSRNRHHLVFIPITVKFKYTINSLERYQNRLLTIFDRKYLCDISKKYLIFQLLYFTCQVPSFIIYCPQYMCAFRLLEQ
jgi:hypothetical protein